MPFGRVCCEPLARRAEGRAGSLSHRPPQGSVDSRLCGEPPRADPPCADSPDWATAECTSGSGIAKASTCGPGFPVVASADFAAQDLQLLSE